MVTEATASQGVNSTAPGGSRIAVVVPTRNAGAHWPELQAALGQQGLDPRDILIIDSSSRDDTLSLAGRSGYRVLSIRAEDFGHGKTRQMACDLLPDADFLVYLTQDSVPEADAIRRLCTAFEDPAVGAAYGRQAPRTDANPIERHARLFNYPDRSHSMTFEARARYGIKAAFLSNSFAGYRRSALLAVGGFPQDVILGEDSVVAARLLMAGWQVAYQADAVAVHSHPLRFGQEFRRYFDTGVHHARESWLLQTFGSASSEGRAFVLSELRSLGSRAPWLIPVAVLRTMNKLVAYRLGQRHRSLPLAFNRNMSAHPNFWAAPNDRTAEKPAVEPSAVPHE